MHGENGNNSLMCKKCKDYIVIFWNMWYDNKQLQNGRRSGRNFQLWSEQMKIPSWQRGVEVQRWNWKIRRFDETGMSVGEWTTAVSGEISCSECVFSGCIWTWDFSRERGARFMSCICNAESI